MLGKHDPSLYMPICIGIEMSPKSLSLSDHIRFVCVLRSLSLSFRFPLVCPVWLAFSRLQNVPALGHQLFTETVRDSIIHVLDQAFGKSKNLRPALPELENED